MPATEQAIRLARIQGLYYISAGMLPLVSMRTFEAITGPKVDRWLVKTVGLLVTVIGLALALAGRRRQITPEIALLAIGSAGALAAVDVVDVAKRRISPAYLLDAAAEIGLLAGWARWLWHRTKCA